MEITKDERELYDRQIRLWGLEGQNRLRNARILILGMEAVSVELAKNLCLAGVGSLTLQSSREITESDLSYNFFVKPSHVGQNAAEASAIAVQRLNHRVVIATETRPLEDLEDDFFQGFGVVVATQTLNRQALINIDTIVRGNNNAFYYAILQGWGGLMFVDLGKDGYKFIVEKELTSTESKVGPVTATQSIIGIQEPALDSGTTTQKVEVEEIYSSLEQALNADSSFASKMKVRHRNKVSPYLPAFLALLENPESPNVVAVTEKLGLPSHIIKPEFVESFVKSRNIQLSGMASIIGGTLSQEVINFLTLRLYPVQNIHVYDGLDGKGPQYYLTS